MNDIVIAGTGAVGSYLAAKLSPGNRVVALARGAHLQALREHGLHVGGTENADFRFEATSVLEPLPSGATVIVTAKTTQLQGIAESLQPVLSEDSAVYLAANGYNPEKALSELLERPVERVLVSLGCHLVKPGVVEFWGGGGVQVQDTETGRKLQALLEEASVPCEIVSHFHSAVWKKLAANCVVNPLTALLKVRNRHIVIPELAPARKAILEEVIAVGRADGAALADGLITMLDDFISKSNNVSSMLQDILRGRPTEMDDINGAVVRIGRRHDIPAPVNQVMLSLVKGLEMAAPLHRQDQGSP